MTAAEPVAAGLDLSLWPTQEISASCPTPQTEVDGAAAVPVSMPAARAWHARPWTGALI